MTSSFTPAVKTILLQHKCHRVRQGKGDHEIWFSPITKKNFPVDGAIKSRHTANGIMKMAGIDHHF